MCAPSPLARALGGSPSCNECASAAGRPASDYEKLGVVGEGTFGVVTRAKRLADGEIVAIKKIRSRNMKNGTDLATLREIMLLQASLPSATRRAPPPCAVP